MKKLVIWATAALAVAILFAVACGRPGETGEQAAPVELRSYEVPEGYKNELAAQLRYVLQGSEESAAGRVIGGVGNTLVVVAPAAVHEGLQALVRDLKDLEPGPPPSQARLTYWVVSGRPVAAGMTAGRPFVTTGPAGLDQIETALAGIAEAQGPTEFRLLERLAVLSTGHDSARAWGQFIRLEHRATVSGETVVAEVEINVAGISLGIATEVVIRAGEYLVLGQGGVPYTQLRELRELQAPDVSLYYVVAADF